MKPFAPARLLLYLQLSLRSLSRHKLRSTLATLGVIIGVTSVVCIVSLGEAATAMVQQQIAAMGSNRLMVVPGSTKLGGMRGAMGSAQSLKIEDMDAILKDCPSVAFLSPNVEGNVHAVHGNLNWTTEFQGSNEFFPQVQSWPVERGRYFTAAEVRGSNKVVVLAATVAKNLFGDEDPIGQSIRVNNLPFTVIGVLKKRGQTGNGHDADDIMVAPYPTVMKKILGVTFLRTIMVSAVSPEAMGDAQDEMRALLRRRHRLPQEEEDDFMIRSQADIAKAAQQSGSVMTGLLGAIAAVSLLVGGIGVMNIMLVSVTERTREIGIRMAVGAKQRDILTQFLAEALCLTLIGGLIGIGLSYVATVAFASLFPWPVTVSPSAALNSLACSMGIGVAFGIYPAYQASELEPVEALRQT